MKKRFFRIDVADLFALAMGIKLGHILIAFIALGAVVALWHVNDGRWENPLFTTEDWHQSKSLKDGLFGTAPASFGWCWNVAFTKGMPQTIACEDYWALWKFNGLVCLVVCVVSTVIHRSTKS